MREVGDRCWHPIFRVLRLHFLFSFSFFFYPMREVGGRHRPPIFGAFRLQRGQQSPQRRGQIAGSAPYSAPPQICFDEPQESRPLNLCIPVNKETDVIGGNTKYVSVGMTIAKKRVYVVSLMFLLMPPP